ncbi:MAG: family 1 glycosylhydrolase [Eubacteriales bacterium]|nr:family 1 glycosylhydrolase [Eubacteriales bacterium]
MGDLNISDWIKNFPANFKWGAASSSYQIEGGYNIDGKGASIWDTFSNISGNTSRSETGNIACDHYHHFREDIDLMHKLGINSYRFSISWPRIFPDGRPDHINSPGVKFYDDIVDYCHQFDIEPIITLFHWDLPQVLEDQGGWFNPQTILYFERYAAWVSQHFSNRVTYFCTINEPQIISNLGYHLGIHAPGRHLDKERTITLLHQLALAHSKAVTAMRNSAQQDIKIGFASTGRLCYPHCPKGNALPLSSDIEAARSAAFTTNEDSWTFCHQIFCDAAILGKAPDFSSIGIAPWDDCETLCPAIDFLGLNIYNGSEVTADASGNPLFTPHYTGFPRTALKWPVTPAVMNYGLQFIYDRYHLPIFICENGLSCNDVVSLDGKVHDTNRIDFLNRYLIELGRAIQAGVDVRGYMHWSFTDNFEWHSGYDERFGLVYIDYPSQKRIPKDSFYWYKNLIREYKML